MSIHSGIAMPLTRPIDGERELPRVRIVSRYLK